MNTFTHYSFDLDFYSLSRITQPVFTDKDGHATFTVQIGPRSSTGIYNTNLEIRKGNYDSILRKAFHVL